MSDSIKILILENVPAEAQLILKNISKSLLNFSYTLVVNEDEYWKAVIESNPDIILSECIIAEYTGLEAIKLANNFCPVVPVIIVTKKAKENLAVKCLQAGASEYVLKEELWKLVPAINTAIEKKKPGKKKDITDQFRKEEQEKFRSVFDAVNDAIIITTNNGEISSVNKECCNLFGYKEIEILGKPFAILLSGYYGASPDYGLKPILKNTEYLTHEKSIEMEGKKKDGSLFPLELKLSGWKTDGNKYFAFIIRDISEKKKIEIKLNNVDEKSKEMHRVKMSFLSNVSHEIRTPLVAILGNANILLEELTGENHVEMIQDILKSSNRLTDALTQILNFTSIEENKFLVKLEPLNLTDVVRQTVQLYEADAASKNLTIKVNLNDKNLFAHTDIKLIKIIMNNLVSNALKFTHNGSVTINLYKSRVVGRELVNASVKDTGIGIPLEDQKIIFEPYRQVSEGFNRSSEGLGLGLAIARRLAQMMNGEIDVDSEEGTGSTFTLHLPSSSVVAYQANNDRIITTDCIK